MTQETGDLFGVTGDKGLYMLLAQAQKKGCPKEWVSEFWEWFKSWEYKGPKTKLVNEDRRWEIVSGMQKAIRRGDAAMATRLALIMTSSDKQEVLVHLWRRLCVTAMEDIGFGSERLIAVSMIAYDIFTKKDNLQSGKPVAVFLAGLLADVGGKDRTICEVAVIHELVKSATPDQLERIAACSANAQWFIALASEKDLYESDDPVDNWMAKEGFKTQNLSDVFIAAKSLVDGQEKKVIPLKVDPHTMIKGLPSYAYDMHTRTGGTAIRVFASKPVIKQALEKFGVTEEPHKALGWIIFYVESELLDHVLLYPGREDLHEASMEVAMAYLNVPFNRVYDLMELVRDNMALLNDCRQYATRNY